MKKLLTLLLLAGAAACPAAAYTVDEIISTTPTMLVEYIYADYYNNDYTYFPYHRGSECVTLKPGRDDKHIVISGIGGTLDFEFELVTSTGVLTNNGVQLQIDGNTRSTGTCKGREGWYMLLTKWTGMKYDCTSYRNKHIVLDITKTEDGFCFSEGDDAAGAWGFMVLPAGSVERPNYCGVVIDQFNFMPFNDANGFAKATVRQYDTEGDDDQLIGSASSNIMTANLYMVDEHQISYPVKVEMNEADNTFSILNLNNMGYAIDATDTRQMTGLLTKYTGTYDPVAGTATLKAGQSGLWDWGHVVASSWWGQTLDWMLFNFTLTPFTDINGQKNEPIVGTYRSEENPYHNDADFGWVTPEDHGKRRTFEGATMSFPAMTYCAVGNTFYATPNWLDTYHDTEILVGADVTLDVELKLEELRWHERDGVYLVGSIVTNGETDKYVDSYDVMIVKGKHSHIDESTFIRHKDLGHANAVVMCAGPDDAYNNWNRPNNVIARENVATDSHDYKFAKLLTVDELGHTPDEGVYTAYIRANYKPETYLSATFHSLQSIGGHRTSVDDLISEGGVPVVKAVAGGIEVSGTENTVNVIDLTGRVVYSGVAGNIQLSAGLYVVRCGSYTTKTAVR